MPHLRGGYVFRGLFMDDRMGSPRNQERLVVDMARGVGPLRKTHIEGGEQAARSLLTRVLSCRDRVETRGGGREEGRASGGGDGAHLGRVAGACHRDGDVVEVEAP